MQRALCIFCGEMFNKKLPKDKKIEETFKSKKG